LELRFPIFEPIASYIIRMQTWGKGVCNVEIYLWRHEPAKEETKERMIAHRHNKATFPVNRTGVAVIVLPDWYILHK
jgi:hypothetical protein